MNALHQDTGPGGRLGEQEASRVVEGNPDHAKVVSHTKYDGGHTRTEENECIIKMNMQHQENQPGGHSSKQVEPGVVKGDLKRRNDGIGVAHDGNRCREDGAMSSAHRESKQLKTRLLAEQQ